MNGNFETLNGKAIFIILSVDSGFRSKPCFANTNSTADYSEPGILYAIPHKTVSLLIVKRNELESERVNTLNYLTQLVSPIPFLQLTN